MDRRHEWALMNRLEEALIHGCAHISERELKLWYGAQRLGIATWRDVRSRWDELSPKEGELKKLKGRDGWYIVDAEKVKSIIS